MKRGIDFVAAISGLLVLSPVIALIAVLVGMTSPGGAIFPQTRVGRDRKSFTCYKFRTMRVGTEHVPTHEAPKSAITGIGRVLRATKLDELPQLWNVLKGEMSLVGPRPCLPTQELLVMERERRGVYAVRPGITGLAQVRGIDMSDPRKLAEEDAVYVASHSFALDVRILFATFLGRGAAGL
ncbi:MAG: sugar transferase [Hyphomicrobium sp.]|nr:sugar transferase [Hyphomicrobium sp.]